MCRVCTFGEDDHRDLSHKVGGGFHIYRPFCFHDKVKHRIVQDLRILGQYSTYILKFFTTQCLSPVTICYDRLDTMLTDIMEGDFKTSISLCNFKDARK